MTPNSLYLEFDDVPGATCGIVRRVPDKALALLHADGAHDARGSAVLWICTRCDEVEFQCFKSVGEDRARCFGPYTFAPPGFGKRPAHVDAALNVLEPAMANEPPACLVIDTVAREAALALQAHEVLNVVLCIAAGSGNAVVQVALHIGVSDDCCVGIKIIQRHGRDNKSLRLQTHEPYSHSIVAQNTTSETPTMTAFPSAFF